MNVKILITNKTKNPIIKSDVLVPIQTGRDIAKESFEGMLGDNTGDNISFLNDKFCELTAIYWAWKNYDKLDDPEYIGFMHYRRHFLFGNKKYKPNFYGLVKYENVTVDYFKEDLTSDENIKRIVFSCDGIIPNPISLKQTVDCKNVYEHYKKFHVIEDLDLAIKILLNNHPTLKNVVSEYLESEYAYFLCMFIFKKNIFFEYCEYIFPLLFEIYNNLKTQNRSSYQERAIGFIAERLTAIFIKEKLANNNFKFLPISFLKTFNDCTFLNNCTISNKSTISNKNLIPIVVGCSNSYVKYLSVLLMSILKHSSKDYIYEINVLDNGIKLDQAKRLNNLFKETNIKIKYIDTSSLLKDINVDTSNQHYSIDTFSRLFIPTLMQDYKKIIYLDIDIIVLDDLKNLYFTELGDKSLAVVKDWVYHALCVNDKMLTDISKYTKNTLQLDSCEQYFQGGVQLMNLDKMRKLNSQADLCELANSMKVYFVDQCLFNFYFKNDVVYLDRKWNYQIYDRERKSFGLFDFLPVDVAKDVYSSFLNPKIVHYSGPWKPWFYPDEEYADEWWKYAKLSSFYEEILSFSDNKNFINYVKEQKKNSSEVSELRNELSSVHFKNINSHFDRQDKKIHKIRLFLNFFVVIIFFIFMVFVYLFFLV